MRLRKLRRLLAREGGFNLVEMLTVMVIMSVVFGGLTTLFVQASNGELEMNNRFSSQINARLALDKIRREVHCASVVATTGTPTGGLYPGVTVTLPSGCSTGSGTVKWCSVSLSNPTRYGLYRTTGATCDSTGVKWADYLTGPGLFSYTAQSTSSLAKLHVEFPVNTTPAKSIEVYKLVDDIVLRNSTRS